MRNPVQKGSGTENGGVAIPIEMPRLSNDEGAATLSAWLVAAGDVVEKGTIIGELETDKATVELEAPADGRIESLVVAAGTEGLKPGAVLARMLPASSAPTARAARESEPPPALPPSEPPTVVPTATRSLATPLAKRVAADRGVALEGVIGTGLGGRIEKADVERVVEGAEVALPRAPVQTEALAGPRPAVQLVLRCRADALVAARSRITEGAGASGEAARLSLNDLVVRAAALALRDVPAANRRRVGGRVEQADAVDVALVVATEQGPRIVAVRDADRKGLAALSGELRTAVDAARGGEGTASPDAATSLLVTSFARFGIESAHPMVPGDLVAVLAVGALVEEPIVEDGVIRIGQRMSLSLAFDPNAVGGGTMAELLAALRRRLEDPLGWLL